MKNKNSSKSFLGAHYLALIVSLILILTTPFLFTFLQKQIYCGSDSACLFWGGTSGFFLVSIGGGWAICIYGWYLLERKTLSTLMKVLFPLVFLIYAVALYNFFYYYSYIKNETVEIRQGVLDNKFTTPITNIKDIYVTQQPMLEGGYYSTYYLELKKGNTIIFAEGGGLFTVLETKYGITDISTLRK